MSVELEIILIAATVRWSALFGGVPLTTSPCYGFLIACVTVVVDDLLEGLLKNIGRKLALQPLQRLYARLAGFEVGHPSRLQSDVVAGWHGRDRTDGVR